VIIPALDDSLSFGTRGSIGNLPLGIDGNVQAPCPHAHRGSIAESIRLIKWRNASSLEAARENREGWCMSSLLNDPAHWHLRAQEAQLLAAQLDDPVAKAATLKIAQEYERLAARAANRAMVKK
jgi:hypothetical protein